MALLSMLRTQLRYWRGQRPRAADLEQIVDYMWRRRARGMSALPFGYEKHLQQGGPRDPDRLRAAQARRLRRTVEYVYRYVPFYHQAMDALGVTPADIRSLADLNKLPITHREQLELDTVAFIGRHPDVVPTIVSRTSGTTGKIVSVYASTEELRYYVAIRAMAWLMTGRLASSDIVQINTDLGSFSTITNSMAARMVGALVLTPGLGGTLDDHLESIFEERHIPEKKPRTSVLYIYPTHLWTLTRRAQQEGVDFRESGLEQIATGAAPVSDDLRQLVLDTWGIALRETYGLNEVVTLLAPQCPVSRRLHFPDLAAYAETLDPETQEPVPDGQPGVLTVTTFYPHRQSMPFLRYWTDDLVILSPDPACVCGAATTQILDIVGRVDHMVIVGTWNVYPQHVGDSLRSFSELKMPPCFTLRSEQREDAQYAILDVEVGSSLSARAEHQLRQRLKEGVALGQSAEVEMGNVKIVVNLHPPGSIKKPFPYKLREGGGPAPWAERSGEQT
jgi:phenylacetate-CoA ligase